MPFLNQARNRAAILLTGATLAIATTGLLAAQPRGLKVGDSAPDFELPNLYGGKVKLSTQLKKGPVALVVLRGFPGYQCPLCTAQFGDLRGKADEFAKTKTQVILVYPGPGDALTKRAKEFMADKTLPSNFLVALDPDYSLTNKLNLRWNAPNETAYPSTFALDSRGKVLFAKVSQSHGERATASDILAAVKK